MNEDMGVWLMLDQFHFSFSVTQINFTSEKVESGK